MNEAEPPLVYPPVNRNKFPWGCLLWGCLSVVLLMIVGTVGVGIAGYSFYTTQVKKYTAEKPVELPLVEYAPEDLEEIESRIQEFKETVEKGETPGEIVLTADDINALISQNKDLKGRVFVSIGEGQVSADVSMPTDAIPGAKGRYFNASVTLNVSLEQGVLIVTVEDAETNGEPVPPVFMNALRKENLAKDVYKDPKTAEIIRRFDRLIIEDNRIILKPATKKLEPTDAEPSDAPPASKE